MNTAPLDLDAIMAEIGTAHAKGQDVARLHSGDLSIWSALGEQIRRLDAMDIAWTVTPGVRAAAMMAFSVTVSPRSIRVTERFDSSTGPTVA